MIGASIRSLLGPRKEALAVGLVLAVAAAGLALMRERAAPNYELSEEQATSAAAADPEVSRFLTHHRFTGSRSIPLDDTLRRVTFFDGPRVVLDAAVAPSGRVEFRQEHRPGHPESGSRLANSPPLLVLFTCLFLLATAVVPLRRMRNLDALAVASFVGTVVLVNERLVVASAALAAVLLTYLIVRCLRAGLGTKRRPGPSVPLFEWITRDWDPRRRFRMLALVTAATAAAFLTITLTSSGESDVATASLSGATELLRGRLPYGNIVEGVVHGDTYPLLNYVLFLPGALITPVTDAFSDRSGALVVAGAAALAAAAGLFRLVKATAESGEVDPRMAGLRAVLAWLAFPPVLLAASGGSNDMVFAATLVWALALSATAGRSSLALAAAAWIKVVPLVLAPVWLARLRGRDIGRAAVATAAVSAGLFGMLVLLGGVGAVVEMVKGLSFQFQRASFHAPWEPFDMEGLQVLVQAGLVAAVVWAALRIRRDELAARDPARVAALMAAFLLWVQLAANYWSWAYLPWAIPFVAIALLAGSRGGASLPSTR